MSETVEGDGRWNCGEGWMNEVEMKKLKVMAGEG